MRLPLILTVAALAVSGCVVQNPAMAPIPTQPQVVTPSPDTVIRNSARTVINREMARRLPGRNVAPYTDCVLQNATSSELAGVVDSANAGATVAAIVGRPATAQCIAGVAAAAQQGTA